ncbi:hormone-sensitive lipase-like [Argiope bruennichi]|uniref:hormone-sensitive lipase-like n=1 Tax=Argiope bruennichi TaxID=94029 RepID=UPI002494D563|nr:hormone-sensitive lipase-like [Argiope bruennichi]
MALITSHTKMCRVELMKFNCDFEVIYLSVMNNIDYFFFAKDKYWYGEKFVSLLRELLDHLHWYEENLKLLYDELHRFDLDENHGNGFRSFVLIFERCFSECYKYSKRLINSRSSFFFRVQTYLKEIESLVNVLSDLRPTLNFLIKMLTENPENHLLMPEKAVSPEEILTQCEGISQLGFYGRFQGFYYCTSMRRILQGVGVIVATFSDLYQKSGGPVFKAVLTVLNGIKYIIDPELRAYQIVNVAQNSSVEFLKAFWSLSEVQLMKRLPDWICPKLAVREEIYVPNTSLTLCNIYTKENVVIPVPTSHIPPAPVRCLLLSSVHREGQVLKKSREKTSSAPKSKSLLFHCHGGGFVAQDPDSHEIYLRHWAHDLNAPIISVDYSLSPEAPFPRALEEVLLAYAWVLKNPHKLGWTGEIICFAGDSAGGNVLMSTVLKTISLQIRQPDAVLCSYTPLVLDIVPSPSRLLCWIDPLLPLGFMISCLDAYAGAMTTEEDEYDTAFEHVSSGRRSRKISSISEIFDSSINFLKQCEWIEVEANEPPEKSADIIFYSSENRSVDGSNYIRDFIEKYDDGAIKKSQNETWNYSKEFNIYNFPQDIIFDLKAKSLEAVDMGLRKISEFFMCTSLYQKVIAPLLPNMASTSQKKAQFLYNKKSIFQKMKKLKIVSKNPFMSPLLASDDILKEMPPIYFVSLNFDPCLDDSVAFTKRLRSLNRQVTIDFLDDLPHGFLNFLPFSQEAHNGSNLCVRRLKEAMKLI